MANNRDDLFGLDYSRIGAPFVDIPANVASIDLSTLDWQYQAQPFGQAEFYDTSSESSSSSSSSTWIRSSSSSSSFSSSSFSSSSSSSSSSSTSTSLTSLSSYSSSSSSSDFKKWEAVRYRFSGYQLPMVQLDATGPAYIVLEPHPYYSNQPLYWQKAAFKNNKPVQNRYTPSPNKINKLPNVVKAPNKVSKSSKPQPNLGNMMPF